MTESGAGNRQTTGIRSLLIQRKQLGDAVLLEPAARWLSGQTGHPVGLVSRDVFAPMVALMPHCVPVSLSTWPQRVERVVSFEAKPLSALRVLMTPAREKTLAITRDRDLSWPYRLIYRKGCRVVPNRVGYRAEYFFRLLAGDDALFEPPRLNSPPPEWRPAELPDAYVVIHPTSAWPEKCWDTDKWVETCEALLRTTGRPILLTSGPADWEVAYCAGIASRVSDPRLTNLAGTTRLTDYLALLADAALVIAVDGSASHLAAAFGTPVLTLFGPTNPVHWHYPSSRSLRLWAGDYASERKPAASHIPVADVIRLVDQLLSADHAADGGQHLESPA